MLARIGSTSPNWYGGKLDEISLYNRALSASEVQAIVQAGSAGKTKPGPLSMSHEVQGANAAEDSTSVSVVNDFPASNGPSTLINNAIAGAQLSMLSVYSPVWVTQFVNDIADEDELVVAL
jgi:hypothetical protein